MKPASATRFVAYSNWASEMVVVVTRHPVVEAARMAKPPHPVPISTTWSPGPMPSLAQRRSTFAVEASSNVIPGRVNTAEEYIIVGSSMSSKSSLDRS